jgi:hypothetical protein
LLSHDAADRLLAHLLDTAREGGLLIDPAVVILSYAA